jgi:hypothetical protein
LTTAEVNAGKIVVPRAPGRVYTVVDAWARAIGGAAGVVTSVDVTDTADSPATAVAFARAGLAENAVLRAGAANTTATGLNTAFTQGKAIKVVKNGDDMTTATALDVCIHYTVGSAHAATSGW